MIGNVRKLQCCISMLYIYVHAQEILFVIFNAGDYQLPIINIQLSDVMQLCFQSIIG